MLDMVIHWYVNNKVMDQGRKEKVLSGGELEELLSLIKFPSISENHLIYIYQHQHLYEPPIVSLVKQEAMSRNLISTTFEAILQEKCTEIALLRQELEKYKMGEKLATSILESPYCYSSNA